MITTRRRTRNHAAVVLDYDFHPNEDTVRMFRTPPSGVLRFDDEVLVVETRCYGGILRHYAFSEHWFKVNVSIDEQGQPVSSGDGPDRFAFNCDIATPMERDGNSIFGVDLFIDVLVRTDAASYRVQDEDEFEEMLQRGLLSEREAAGAKAGLAQLVGLIEDQGLLSWLDDFARFGPCDPPVAPPVERMAIPARMQPGARTTW